MLELLTKAIGSWIAIFFISISTISYAQNTKAYFVQFTDKDTTVSVNLISKKGLERRAKYQIPISYSDYPVNRDYVEKVLSDTSVHLRYTLKWYNAIVVSSDNDLASLLSNAFIKDVKYVGKVKESLDPQKPLFHSPVMKLKDINMSSQDLKPADYGAAYEQLKQIGITDLHNKGLDGKGVSIAIFDAGFKNIHTIQSFLKHQANGLLKYGYDVAGLDNELNINDNHGTACASCFGAYEKGKYIGSSPQVNITLFRTEFAATEYPIEELNWCKAAELADSLGVDMITSSLGYNRYDDAELSYQHSDLDGKTSYIAQSATLAVEKGIVVINSAGNEGDNKWRKIGTPADAPAVITVGAVDLKGNPGRFTSQGYNATGRVKPDISACGVLAAVASPGGGYYKGYGTSYATPIAAGGVACLLQAFPELEPKEIGNLVRLSATQSQNPDSLIGYGVAQFDIAYAYQSAIQQNQTKTDILKFDSSQIVIYGIRNSSISYKLYSHKKLFGFIKVKQKVQSDNTSSVSQLYRIHLNEKTRNKRSKNYTLRLIYPKTVGISPLTFSGLSW